MGSVLLEITFYMAVYFHVHYITHSLYRSCCIIPTSQLGKLRLRELRRVAPRDAISEWKACKSDSCSSDSEARVPFSGTCDVPAVSHD